MTKKDTLAKFLDVNVDDIEEGYGNALGINGEEYVVLTDEEADEGARDYIVESIWAFNPSFLSPYLPEGVDEEAIKIIQAKCEGANEPLKNMIDDLDLFVEDAIAADGRGHFLSFYDGEESEEGEYFIYRVN